MIVLQKPMIEDVEANGAEVCQILALLERAGAWMDSAAAAVRRPHAHCITSQPLLHDTLMIIAAVSALSSS